MTSSGLNISPAGPLNLLSLDAGGGIRTLSQLLILEKVMARIQARLSLAEPPKPCEIFHLIGSSGAGGIAALLLGRFKLSASETTASYISIASSVYAASNKKLLSRGGPAFKATTLENKLAELIEHLDLGTKMCDIGTEGCECKKEKPVRISTADVPFHLLHQDDDESTAPIVPPKSIRRKSLLPPEDDNSDTKTLKEMTITIPKQDSPSASNSNLSVTPSPRPSSTRRPSSTSSPSSVCSHTDATKPAIDNATQKGTITTPIPTPTPSNPTPKLRCHTLLTTRRLDSQFPATPDAQLFRSYPAPTTTTTIFPQTSSLSTPLSPSIPTSTPGPAAHCTLAWEAARACAADPAFLKPVALGVAGVVDDYVGPGKEQLNPSECMLGEAVAVFGPRAKLAVLLSLGAGYPGIVPRGGATVGRDGGGNGSNGNRNGGGGGGNGNRNGNSGGGGGVGGSEKFGVMGKASNSGGSVGANGGGGGFWGRGGGGNGPGGWMATVGNRIAADCERVAQRVRALFGAEETREMYARLNVLHGMELVPVDAWSRETEVRGLTATYLEDWDVERIVEAVVDRLVGNHNGKGCLELGKIGSIQ